MPAKTKDSFVYFTLQLHFTSLHFIKARAGQRTPAALSDSYTGPYIKCCVLVTGMSDYFSEGGTKKTLLI